MWLYIGSNSSCMKAFCFLLLPFLFWLTLGQLGQALAQKKERQLVGQVVGPDGKPLGGANISLNDFNETTLTDLEGNFRLALPKSVVIGHLTIFVVNGQKVGEESFSYRAAENFVSISLKAKTDTEWVQEIEVFLGNDKAKKIKITINGQSYLTNESGMVEFPAGKGVNQEAKIEADGYLIDSKYYTVNNQRLSLYLEAKAKSELAQPDRETNQPVPVDNIRQGNSEPIAEKRTGLDYQKNFGAALNQLEFEKQQLEEQNSQLESEMQQIEVQLRGNVLTAPEKKELEKSLNQVQNQLIANGLAYEAAQERVIAVIDRMRRDLTDSLSTAANAKIQTIEAEKNAMSAEFKRELIALIGIALLLLLLAGVGFWVANKFRAQKNQLTKTTILLEENLREIQLQKKEISTQRDFIEEKNHYLENAYEEIKQQKSEIERQNYLITTGVRYAESIQTAILPTNDTFRSVFSEHMVIFMPKDIVSGDIYWCSQVGNKMVLAVVDCTGHGVPGAFMSLIAFNMLGEEIQKNQEELSPAAILHGMNARLGHTLQQEHTLNDDSMDVALCVVEPSNGGFQVRFAGAKRPLIYHRANSGELEEIRGDRQSLGGGYRKKVVLGFTEHQIRLDKGDTIYLHTDGLTDQANAEMEKFSQTGFQQALVPFLASSLPQQRNHLYQAIQTYMGNAPQRDDITLIGVRL